jgi:hypothetical protein
MLGDGERVVMVVVAVHVGDLQIGFEDGGFDGHSSIFLVVVGAVLGATSGMRRIPDLAALAYIRPRHG